MKSPKLRLFLIGLALVAFILVHFWQLRPMPKLRMQPATFADLPGWNAADPQVSLQAFTISCKAFLKQNPEKSVGSHHLDMKAKDWQPICEAASQLSDKSAASIRQFFEQWFTPVAFFEEAPVRGLFTGYYMPVLKGSLIRTERFKTPIYGVPEDVVTANLGRFDDTLRHHRKLVGRVHKKELIPYYTREQISRGALKGKAPVIVWIESPVDRQFLEIEGSGVVELPDGKRLFVGYAGENGAPYRSIASVLIKQGDMTREEASMQRIRRYFKEHPDKVNAVLNHNESFVFFSLSKQEAALGAQGVPLTPGYSLAVDREWVPLGAPIWLHTTRPHQEKDQVKFQRLMIAQDTGGAIKGPVRGDVYWGTGDNATYVAGHMKSPGVYWVLLPQQLAKGLAN